MAIRGLGPKKREYLRNLGVETEQDLLFQFPRQYEDRRGQGNIADALDGETYTLRLRIAGEVHVRFLRRGLRIAKVQATDDTDIVTLTFFNQPYIAQRLKPGMIVDVYGILKRKGAGWEMTNPVVENPDGPRTGRIVPVYALTKGISQADMFSFTEQALELYLDSVPEILPVSIREKRALLARKEALAEVHRPTEETRFKAARRSLVYEEFFFFCVGIERRKSLHGDKKGTALPGDHSGRLTEALPFSLTTAQRRVLKEIIEDMQRERPMNRLLQGDVGSGKTVVAFGAMVHAWMSGTQSVFMVPTEIVARQHAESLERLLLFSGARVALLLGSTPLKQKAEIKRALARGEIDMLISTHAALQEDVQFQNLTLAVTDEQHRFGVSQRALLSEKGDNPHVLVMSATPIPRTVALILYADLDLSTIDELPKNRIPIETYCISAAQEARMADFIRKNLQQGRQAFIVCPAIETGEMDLQSVEEVYEKWRTTYGPPYSVGILHGKMAQKEKEKTMRRFAEGDIDVLVATTVVEVGVDVPNANVMAVYDAHRFGLAQLHQLRGRVGRGAHSSYCVLINGSDSEEAAERLRILQETNDGFAIASEDLRIRGAGELLGGRQHGMPQMALGDIMRDRKLFHEAGEDATALIEADPQLLSGEHRELKRAVEKAFACHAGPIAFN